MDDLNKLSKKELMEMVRNQQMPGMTQDYPAATVPVYENELEKLDKLAANNNPYGIPYRETSDHKNVMLYTAINKRVGPLHPDNARSTMIRWKRAGIQIYTTARTPEQVEAFKQTDEYKRHLQIHEATRKQRRAQSTKGKTEAMMVEIARVTAAAVAGAKNG
jgi:hypothetical protein